MESLVKQTDLIKNFKELALKMPRKERNLDQVVVAVPVQKTEIVVGYSKTNQTLRSKDGDTGENGIRGGVMPFKGNSYYQKRKCQMASMVGITRK